MGRRGVKWKGALCSHETYWEADEGIVLVIKFWLFYCFPPRREDCFCPGDDKHICLFCERNCFSGIVLGRVRGGWSAKLFCKKTDGTYSGLCGPRGEIKDVTRALT